MIHLAIPYRRFSSDKQTGNTSLTRQQDLVTKWLSKNPEYKTLPQFDYVDEAVSGYHGDNIKFGQLGEFISEVEKGTFTRYKSPILLIENFDRFGRLKPRKALGYITDILEAGVSICLLDRGEVITPDKVDDDFFLMQLVMTASRAHGESKRKSDNVTKAWQIKAEGIADGATLTRNVPFWINPDNRQLVIPERAKLVERIFKMRLESMSCYAIGKILNQEGIPVYTHRKVTPGKEYKKRRVAPCWHSANVSGLLSNKAVLGILPAQQVNKHNKHRQDTLRTDTPGYYPAVISATLFAAVQSLKDEKHGKKRVLSNINSIQIFKKMLRCVCGAYLDVTGCRSTYAGVFKCASARAGSTLCTKPSINRQKVEESLLTRLLPSLTRLDVNHELSNQIETLKSEIEGLDILIRKGWEDYENSDHPFYLSDGQALRISQNEKKREEKRSELAALNVTEQSSVYENISHLDLSDYTQRCEARVIIKRMISSITIDTDKGLLDVHLVNGNTITGFCIDSTSNKKAVFTEATDEEKQAELTAIIGERLPLVIPAGDPVGVAYEPMYLAPYWVQEEMEKEGQRPPAED